LSGAADMEHLLGRHGPFARLPGFSPRPAQQDMAAQVADAIEGRGLLVAESPTGTGKTYAYLAAALNSGRKVIVSTGTRNLQDQIYRDDLPAVLKALSPRRPPKTALLKGRANYLCLHRLRARAGEQGDFSGDAEGKSSLAKIRAWAAHTAGGDLETLPDVDLSGNAALFRAVTSTADNCLGNKCDDHEKCFVRRARAAAHEADLIVINHHLFFSDLVLKKDGFGNLLPDADAVIFDEAHQLPQTALDFLGVRFSSGQVFELARDVDAAALGGRNSARLIAGARALRNASDGVKGLAAKTAGRLVADLQKEKSFARRESHLRRALENLCAALEAGGGDGGVPEERLQLARRASDMLGRLEQICDAESEDEVRWFALGEKSYVLHCTPLSAAPVLSGYFSGQERAFVFTSATLAAGKSFAHFTESLGLAGARAVQWPAAFDYANNALLYLPPGLPDPRHPDFSAHMMEAALRVVAAAGGRTFLLFTSHRALSEARRMAERKKIPWPLLVQGDEPRNHLLKKFRAAGNAVLMGTASFWEGVDVRGDALSCVVIDKLPFPPPDNPVLQARYAKMEREGRNWFTESALPQAVLTLKQGAGRLIRDDRDRGVLVICDRRLGEKSYGKIFMQSLPPMRRTVDIAEVQKFFAAAKPS